MWAAMPCQNDGTPADNVTFSFSKSSCRLAPSNAAPGNTSFAPVSAQQYGKPHALTWNIGTTGSTTSRADKFSASGRQAAYVCSMVERWLYSTPLGLPVVPEV